MYPNTNRIVIVVLHIVIKYWSVQVSHIILLHIITLPTYIKNYDHFILIDK